MSQPTDMSEPTEGVVWRLRHEPAHGYGANRNLRDAAVDEIEALQMLLYTAITSPEDDPDEYGVVLDHVHGSAWRAVPHE